MSLFTGAEARDLAEEFIGSQPPTLLALYREVDQSGATTAMAPQAVIQTTGRGSSNAQPGGGTSEPVRTGYRIVHFASLPPFDVKVGDWFELDGQKGGRITRVRTDPVLGVIYADGALPEGMP